MGLCICICHRDLLLAKKRHHDHSTSYKGHLVEACLQVQRFSPLSLWREVWQHLGTYDTERVESFSLIVKAAGRLASRELV